MRAMVLDEERSEHYVHVATTDRGLLPVLFSITNHGSSPLPLAQDDFRLRVDGGQRVAPVLPGRVASLLRDQSGSAGAAWAGYLALGILATPAIHSAEQQEEAAMRSSRDAVFSAGRVDPGGTLLGYLFFEPATPPDEIRDLVLELRLAQRSESADLRLRNPYLDP